MPMQHKLLLTAFLALALSLVSCGQERLTFYVPEAEAAPGETVCLDVTTELFTEILTMQYSLAWDDDVLQFVEVTDFGLPGLSAENFGRPADHPDRLTVAWFEPNLLPAKVPDGRPLFKVCFEVTGRSGQRSAVAITGDPTIVEVANVREEVLEPVLVEGGVIVE